jgi:hypothetical protein
MPAPRRRPDRVAPEVAETLAEPQQQSGPKAKAAVESANRSTRTADPSEAGPVLAPSGQPYARVLATASDLIPTGDYANVTIGPAQIMMWVDPGDPNGVSQETLDNLARVLNQLTETVSVDVVGVQRTLVIEGLQQQLAGEGN